MDISRQKVPELVVVSVGIDLGIESSFAHLARRLDGPLHLCSYQVTTGGTTLKDDIMRLYNVVHILVGTPGRVLDLADKSIANLKKCNMLIMDEVCQICSNTCCFLRRLNGFILKVRIVILLNIYPWEVRLAGFVPETFSLTHRPWHHCLTS